MSQAKYLEQRISPDTKRKALVMLARGDTKVSIAKALGIHQASVAHIAKSNADLLENIEERVDNYRAQTAAKILTKSQQRILARLDNAEVNDKLSELTAVMKTAYDQVRLEEGKPTSISSSTSIPVEQATPENLEALVEAIKSGDEVELQRLVFRAKP